MLGEKLMVEIREANTQDLNEVLNIYNQGIEDRIATLEEGTKDFLFIQEWFEQHQGRFKVIVAEYDGKILGWASLNRYNNRCAYEGVADLSVYISRDYRGKGIGSQLLSAIEETARTNNFHKIVLFTFPFNKLGQGLYSKKGYREVGVFKNQGILEGDFVDVMAMEKLLS